jgi:hypothetical protein
MDPYCERHGTFHQVGACDTIDELRANVTRTHREQLSFDTLLATATRVHLSYAPAVGEGGMEFEAMVVERYADGDFDVVTEDGDGWTVTLGQITRGEVTVLPAVTGAERLVAEHRGIVR